MTINLNYMAFNIDFRFLNVTQKVITLEKIKEFIVDEGTKRIHFAATHQSALRKAEGKDYAGRIILPFDDTVNAFIKADLGSEVTLFKSKFGEEYYRQIRTLVEFEAFEKFIDTYKDIVFLRDNLDLSIALSSNFEEDRHSVIGELEYLAKYKDDKSAEQELALIIQEWIEKLPYYKYADYICAMPCSNPAKKSLPRRIVDELNGFENISNDVHWQSKERSLKDAASIEEKLPILEKSNLAVDRNLNGKAVFLLDDLYMSGLSMQYVAMKLKEAGAKWVFGLCLVKSRNNTTR